MAGQSGFRLRDPAGGPVVFVDPFLSPHQGRTWEAPLGPDELGHQADVILCTHQHIDHFDQPTLRAAAAVPGARFTLVVPRPIVQMALDLGIPGERVIGAQPKQSLEVAGVPVHPVPARHGVEVSDAYMFTAGLGFAADAAFGASSMLIAVPTGLKIFSWLGTRWGGRIRSPPP